MMIEQARHLFCNDRFATELTGIRIVAVAPHFAQCELSVESSHRNAMGGVMGGAIFTLADFAFAIAANTDCFDDGTLCWVSTTSTIAYLNNTADNKLTAKTHCLKQGRNSCSYEITVTDSTDKAIATILTQGDKIPTPKTALTQ